MEADAKPNETSSKFKNQYLVNNPKTALLAATGVLPSQAAAKPKPPVVGKEPAKSVFAAYDNVKVIIERV